MENVTRGTTPSIIYKFSSVKVSDMAVCYLTITQASVTIELDLSDAEADTVHDTLTWTLTQEDTLKIKADERVNIQCRYRLNDGLAGASKITTVQGERILKDGEI